jgi:methylated-DNA-[protein]-cysteine S-methyltransferase
MSVRHVTYEVQGWGTGELVFEDGRLAWHELPRAAVKAQADGEDSLAERVVAYFAGSRDSFADVELDLDGLTDFERSALEAMRAIRYGETATYAEVAAAAGHLNAQRAVGSVCGRNRFALVVPCHRVVAANGLGSYGSLGVEYKQRLLELEGVAL